MEIVNKILCKGANVTFTTVRIVKVIISLVGAINFIISDILIF